MKRKIVFFLLWNFVACGKPLPPLDEGFTSINELAEHHLRCVEANDAECLNRQLLTYKEFSASVYPNLPEAKNNSISEKDYWGWTLPDRQKAIKNFLSAYGGKKLLRFSVGDAKKILRFGKLTVHRDILLTVDWQEKEVKDVTVMATRDFLKAVVEVNGRFKLWNMVYE